jgi:hypothetical protein
MHVSLSGAEFEAVSFGGLSKEWRRFLANDAAPLSIELRRRSDRARAAACFVSFPSGMVLTVEQIALLEANQIIVRILYGSRDECMRAFLAREATSGRGLTAEHWLAHNRQPYERLGRPEYERYRVPAFGADGSRRPLSDMIDAICTVGRDAIEQDVPGRFLLP